MGCTKEGKIESEVGFNERDGAYGKIKVIWEFKGSDNTESQKESDKTSKDPGEVNSTDKDDH